MIIDAHLHIWDLARAEYSWLRSGELHRSFGFDEIKPTLARLGVTDVILVQAADEAADTELMLEAARAHPEVAGVVAWAPLDRPGELAGYLDRWREDPAVVGIRNLIHNREPGWLLDPERDASLGLLAAAGTSIDFVTSTPAALAELPVIAERHPELRIVLDHLGSPPIGGDRTERMRWRALLERAAANPAMVAKVSGFRSSVGPPDAWTLDDVRWVVDAALEVFGPSRLMYGGDWPVCRTAGGYERVWDAVGVALSGLSGPERDALFGVTARDFYRLERKDSA
jgi:L-fuconolactonase